MPTATQTQALQVIIENRGRQLFKRKAISESLGFLGLFLPFSLKRVLSKVSPRLGYLFFKTPELVIHDYASNLSVNIDVRSNIEREMLTGNYDGSLVKIIKEKVNPGMVCLDIGANVGALSLFLCQQVGTKGKVLAFEPGPHFFNRLKNNISLNPSLKNRIEFFNLGLSNKASTMYWQEDPEFPGNAWLLGDSGTPVPVERLDEVLKPLPLSRLDFIKIDVEGMELEVLEGAVETIKKFKPKILFESSMEFEAIRNKPIRQELLTLLKSLNYEIWGVDESGNLYSQTYPALASNSFALPLGQNNNA